MMKKMLSIIVPVYNEEHTIACVLDALVLLDMPDWQCGSIIVDDGSTDGTHEIVASWVRNAEALGRQNIRVVRCARNCERTLIVSRGCLRSPTIPDDYPLTRDNACGSSQVNPLIAVRLEGKSSQCQLIG